MLNRRTVAAAAAAFLFVATALPAIAQTWRKHEYKADGFSVEFAGEVKITPTEVSPDSRDRIERSTNYLHDSGSSAFIVGATLAKYSVEFEKGVAASFTSLQCKSKMSDTMLNFPRGKAQELSGTDCTADGSLAVEARYFQSGKWFYQVLAIYPKGANKEMARRFVTSFALAD